MKLRDPIQTENLALFANEVLQLQQMASLEYQQLFCIFSVKWYLTTSVEWRQPCHLYGLDDWEEGSEYIGISGSWVKTVFICLWTFGNPKGEILYFSYHSKRSWYRCSVGCSWPWWGRRYIHQNRYEFYRCFKVNWGREHPVLKQRVPLNNKGYQQLVYIDNRSVKFSSSFSVKTHRFIYKPSNQSIFSKLFLVSYTVRHILLFSVNTFCRVSGFLSSQSIEASFFVWSCSQAQKITLNRVFTESLFQIIRYNQLFLFHPTVPMSHFALQFQHFYNLLLSSVHYQ